MLQAKQYIVIEKNKTGLKVKVCETIHPMEEAHYIEWISVVFNDGKVVRKFLKPGEVPEFKFCKNKASASVISSIPPIPGF